MRTPHVRWHRLALVGAAAAAGSIAAIGAPAPVRASLLVALEMPVMVERADTVAVVDVASARAAWDARHERIVTTVELTVVESWKGSAAPATRLVIAQPGGTVGDVTMTVFGMPRFSPGERALVFLHGPADRAAVVGLAQGKRAMSLDPARGWIVGPPERAGAAFVRTAASGARVPVIVAASRPLTVLRAEIGAEIRAQAARGGGR